MTDAVQQRARAGPGRRSIAPCGCAEGGTGSAPGGAPPRKEGPWPDPSAGSPPRSARKRRRRDRERLERATRELLSSEGWKRWLRARATFHSYSFHNTLLIASQARALGFEPTYVAGFRAWLRLNRVVRKGEKALRILAPVRVKKRGADGEETNERRVFFRTVFVFDTLSRESPGGAERRRRAFDRGRRRRGDGCWVAGATRRVAEVAQHPAGVPLQGTRGALIAATGIGSMV
jgi:hypothetical protein